MGRFSTSPAVSADRIQTVYFAFGSNLHLAQMAQRCPESRYIGRGRLHGFKWQINTRGYANIYPSPDDRVEGLCFLLSLKDEKKLDLKEGVAVGSYEKRTIPVEICSANPLIVGRRVKEVNNHIHGHNKPVMDQPSAWDLVDCLVYVNYDLISDGRPRTEYVSRINAGVVDAKRLGISSEYFDRYFTGPMHWKGARQPLDDPVRSSHTHENANRDSGAGATSGGGGGDDNCYDREIHASDDPRSEQREDYVRDQNVDHPEVTAADAPHHRNQEEMVDRDYTGAPMEDTGTAAGTEILSEVQGEKSVL